MERLFKICVICDNKSVVMQTSREKAGMIVLASAGVLALVFGIFLIRHNIRAPFRLKPVEKIDLAKQIADDPRHKDTDKDGLSDFDELYIYKTSPYLEDTDSDGKNDAEELSGGTDPNCPEGKECEASGAAAGPETAVPFVPGFDPADFGISPEPAPLAPKSDVLNNLSADDIRKALREAGIGEETLKKLDDATLLKLYQEAVKEGGQ